MRYTKLICVLLLTLIINGCSSNHKQFTFTPIEDGKAEIYFVRDGGHKIKVGILNDNNESLTYLYPDTYFKYTVTPGYYAFRADCQFNREEVILLTKANTRYCVRVDNDSKKMFSMTAKIEHEFNFEDCMEDLAHARYIYSLPVVDPLQQTPKM